MGKVHLFYDCRLLRDHQLVKDNLWIQDGKIIAPEAAAFVCDASYDCGGAIIAPGFIDLKINGGFGIDFSNLTSIESHAVDAQTALAADSPYTYTRGGSSASTSSPERVASVHSAGSLADSSAQSDDYSSPTPEEAGIATRLVDYVARQLPKTGVTSFCPTIISSPAEKYHQVLPQIKPRPGSELRGATILGVHLDGPFLDKKRAGAHKSEYIRSFENGLESLEEVYGSLDNVRLVTLAPEVPHACDVIRTLRRWNVRVSLGHSSSTLQQGLAAVESGATMLTYLFNAMPTFHHRDPSLVGLLATDLPIPVHKREPARVYFGIIADGNHTHPAAIRMAYKMAPESLILVSDGVAPLGLGRGTYTLGDTELVVEESDDEDKSPRVTVRGTSTLSGSIASLDTCVRNLIKHTDCSLVYALEAATLRPALAMEIADDKGTLNYGSDADFVLLGPEKLDILATFIAGRAAYRKEESTAQPTRHRR